MVTCGNWIVPLLKIMHKKKKKQQSHTFLLHLPFLFFFNSVFSPFVLEKNFCFWFPLPNLFSLPCAPSSPLLPTASFSTPLTLFHSSTLYSASASSLLSSPLLFSIYLLSLGIFQENSSQGSFFIHAHTIIRAIYLQEQFW